MIAAPISRVFAFAVLFAIGAVATPSRARRRAQRRALLAGTMLAGTALAGPSMAGVGGQVMHRHRRQARTACEASGAAESLDSIRSALMALAAPAHSPLWRAIVSSAAFIGAFLLAGGSAEAANCNASDTTSLSNCITNASNGDTITLSNSITLTANLPPVRTSVTFLGNNNTLNGNNVARGLFVFSGTVCFVLDPC